METSFAIFKLSKILNKKAKMFGYAGNKVKIKIIFLLT